MQEPAVAVIIIYRIVKDAAIIPKRQIANLPDVTASELFSYLMIMQIAE